MRDEIIEELWEIKDGLAREHGNDVRKLAAYLQAGKRWEDSFGLSESSAVDTLDEALGHRLKTGGDDLP